MEHLSQSPRDDAFVQNPYPFYAAARESGELFYWNDYEKVAAASHRAVNQLFRDPNWGREILEDFRPRSNPRLAVFEKLDRHSMLELDPPRHTRLRGLVMRAFTSRHVAALETDIRNLANTLIDRLPRCAELQKNYCELLPIMVVAKLLGVASEMCPQMLHWSHQMVAMYQAKRDQNVETRAEAAAVEFTEFIKDEIERRRTQPREGLISLLIEAEDGHGKLSSDEVISTCILLLNAGHEATANALGNGVKAIVESGLQPARILSAARRQQTIEEILRFDPPVHIFTRVAKQDCQVFGEDFHRGDSIALILAAANRDADIWENPDMFWPQRQVLAHTSFGAGIHFCVGAPLARLELAVGLATLFERFPKLSIVKEVRFADRYHFHGLEELWIENATLG